MKLRELLKDLKISNRKEIPDISITDIAYDSRKVSPGALFFALSGQKTDGNAHIPEARSKGAVAVLSEKAAENAGLPVLKVAQARGALAQASSRFFGEPTQEMAAVGVTGTNGKTTITYLLETILKAQALSPAVVGTVNYRYGNKIFPAPHTTPEAYDLQRFLRDAKEEGCKSLVMEVSSHALDLRRADGIHFDAAVFTNLSSEHLDYHRDMEDYFQAKRRLFQELLPESAKGEKTAILNADDAFAGRLVSTLPSLHVLTYSLRPQKGASLYPISQDLSLRGIEAMVQSPGGVFPLSSPLLGAFNLSNLLAASATALALKINLKKMEDVLREFNAVPGRLERVPNSLGLHVFVDYAHTPDALKNVLSALRFLLKKEGGGRLIVVFGCGGDRDRSKRPLMGREVARLADFAFVTSDNPRTEDPHAIIEEILPGLSAEGWKKGREFQVEADRRRAIGGALSAARPGDVVLIAGKGHEDYQIVGTEKFHFDDREVAREFLGSPQKAGSIAK